jgi:hypothetical protein
VPDASGPILSAPPIVSHPLERQTRWPNAEPADTTYARSGRRRNDAQVCVAWHNVAARVSLNLPMRAAADRLFVSHMALAIRSGP